MEDNYIIVVDRKISGCTAIKREIVGSSTTKTLTKKLDMVKRMYKNEKIRTFKEVKS